MCGPLFVFVLFLFLLYLVLGFIDMFGMGGAAGVWNAKTQCRLGDGLVGARLIGIQYG